MIVCLVVLLSDVVGLLSSNMFGVCRIMWVSISVCFWLLDRLRLFLCSFRLRLCGCCNSNWFV